MVGGLGRVGICVVEMWNDLCEPEMLFSCPIHHLEVISQQGHRPIEVTAQGDQYLDQVLIGS